MSKTALEALNHIRRKYQPDTRAPYVVWCLKCRGGGKMNPPRAEWDLLPDNCTACAGSGRVAIPWAELFKEGRAGLENHFGHLPEREKCMNAKARKKEKKRHEWT